MIFSAHQPNYFPYLGLFYKIYKSDYFVFLDDVQFTKSSGPAHDRNVISDGGRAEYIKVPIKYHFKDNINEVKINYDINWEEQHFLKIEKYYSLAPYYKMIVQDFEPILHSKYSNLAELNIAIIEHICKKSGIDCIFSKSSEYSIKSQKTERLAELGRTLECDIYYSGSGAKVYMDCDLMKKNGIDVIFSDYFPVQYKKNGEDCKPNMSVLDYLFYYGYDFSSLGWEKI